MLYCDFLSILASFSRFSAKTDYCLSNLKSDVKHFIFLRIYFSDFNKTLLSWDADTAALLPKSSKHSTKGDSNLGELIYQKGDAYKYFVTGF